MNVVGIDVSKGKSMVAIISSNGEVIASPYEVLHLKPSLEALANRIKGLTGETKVVMEHTSHYYEPLAQTLVEEAIFVSAVNPKLIKDYGNNSLRKVKSDKADAMKIARYGLNYWGELPQYCAVDIQRGRLKTINRQFEFYTKQKTAVSNHLIALLDKTFPNIDTLFDSPVRKDGRQKWVDFAKAYWHVETVRSKSSATFKKQYKNWCHRHGYLYKESKAEKIYGHAAQLVAILPKDDFTKEMIKQAIVQLNTLSKTVESLRARMLEIAAELPEYPVVMAMCGVGKSLGPQLMAEIGDVQRFKKRGALVAYAGVDPGVQASGTQTQKSVKTSKRGAPLLRKTLFQVMTALIKNKPDDTVYHFLDKKRAEGKPYYVYMTAGANKFLRIYYARVNEYLALLKVS